MRKQAKTKVVEIEFTVVGVSMRFAHAGKVQLANQVPFQVILRREPDNPVDENAIEVVLPGTFPLKALRHEKMGYLRATIAAKLAPLLDAGEVVPLSLVVTAVAVQEGTAELTGKFEKIPKTA